MVLTPDKIAALNAITGGTMSPTNPTAGPSFADQLRGAAPQNDATPSVVSQTADNYMGSVAPAASDVNDILKGLSGGRIDTGAPKGSIGKAADDLSQGGGSISKTLSGVEKATLGTASDAVQAIFAPLSAPLQTLIQHRVVSPDGQKFNEAVKPYIDELSSWAQAHPDIARTFSDALNVGGAALGSGALDTSVSDAATATKNAVTSAATNIKGAAVGAKDAVVDTAKVAKNAVAGLNTPKTLDEILATPEAQVKNLKPEERAAYWKAQSDTQTASTQAELDKIKQAHEDAMTGIKQKADAAQAKVDAEYKAHNK